MSHKPLLLFSTGKPQEWQSITSTAPLSLNVQGKRLVVGMEARTTPGTYSSVTVDEYGRVISGLVDGTGSMRIYMGNNTVYSFKPDTDGGVLLIGGSYLSAQYTDLIKFHSTSPSNLETMLFKSGGNVSLYEERILTGMTGSNGKINISIQNGVMYIENRTGASQYIFFKVL